MCPHAIIPQVHSGYKLAETTATGCRAFHLEGSRCCEIKVVSCEEGQLHELRVVVGNKQDCTLPRGLNLNKVHELICDDSHHRL